MNGLTDAILSTLLSWIRVLIANLWNMVSSEDGGALFQFFAAHWLKILLVLCIGGYAADRIIYFIRWRPHYVWLSRWKRLRGKKQEPTPVQPEWVETPVQEPEAWHPASGMTFAPAQQEPSAAEPAQVYAPVQEPVFFEENEADWEEQWPEPEPQQRPKSAAYYRDVQAGFAPPVPPEQLYSPSVHPGLNENAFRQNFGLDEPEERPAPVLYAPAFRPFTAAQDQEQPPRTESPFSRLAKRARDLVGGDPDHELTIRDLQSTVDVSKAFHEPVYPQPLNQPNDSREVRR